MSMPYTRAPHRGESFAPGVPATAPNAALLIDFDNVTMGMRSNLSRDLQQLLESDIIKGKVTVQRAYADWRRYPQYIVPLSENSIDLIFAPAYGSSKKNATDIRMAIDAVELVFVRPEIGTFILLTGDSDFSSCVLKLKEYGKYVIGVGIQESSSDILVQNCDEYYSYTSLTGLTKTTGGDQKSADPWVLVEQALKKMVERDDVMRSDRLKQVMIELDSTFDEGSFGFSKFSRFLTEAASKKLVDLRKLENGQYEVALPGKTAGGSRSTRSERSERGDRRGRGRERDRSNGRGREPRRGPEGEGEAVDIAAEAPAEVDETATLPSRDGGYSLLTRTLEALRDDGRHPVRDSDVKRRMLELDASFDEGELGFPKFSRFLQQAEADAVITLQRGEGGNYEVGLVDGTGAAPSRDHGTDPEPRETADAPPEAEAQTVRPDASPEREAALSGPVVRELRPEDVVDPDAPGRRLGPRGGTTRRRDDDAPPPLLPGQAGGEAAVTPKAESAPAARSTSKKDSGRKRAHKPAPKAETAPAPVPDGTEGGPLDLEALGLPTDNESRLHYLSNSWRGVGKKTAELLVDHFGEEVFTVLQNEPDRVRAIMPAGRAERVIEAWGEDYARRVAQIEGAEAASGSASASRSGGGSEGKEGGGRNRNRRGGRRGRGGRNH